jgi:hypothetical protein
LAPYRLAVVAGGTLVAFFWTVFPSPLTDRAWIRRDLSATISLIAKYVNIITSAMRPQFGKATGGPDAKTSPAYRLEEARRTTFGRVMRHIYSVESHLNWQRWEPAVGGRFPAETYREIAVRSEHILGYLTLVSYALARPPRTREAEDDPGKEQLEEKEAGSFDAGADVLSGVEPTYHTVLLILTLLSNSLLSGLSLPPIMDRLMVVLEDGPDSSSGYGNSAPNTADRTLIDARNGKPHGHAQFVVVQACGTLVSDDVQGLLRAVSRLVGVEDFSVSGYEDGIDETAKGEQNTG